MAFLLPVTMTAQDDVYFVPKKQSKPVAPVVDRTVSKGSTTMGGFDVDAYNRRGMRSYYQKMGTDSLGNDIIEFHVEGDDAYYGDTLYAGPVSYGYEDNGDDYTYTRRMYYWDDFSNPWLYSSYNWHSPWWYYRYGWNYPLYYGSYMYDPWYYGSYWYDPWYYGGYPGYYGYYGWNYPWYYGGYYGGWWHHPHYVAYTSPTGTQNHGRINYSGPRGTRTGNTASFSSGTFGGSRVGNNSGFRNRDTSTRTTTSGGRRVTQNANGNFGGSRSSSTYTPSNSNTRSTNTYTPSSSSSHSSGSFGGGGSFGGSRSSGGGGSFGGSRSSGGGGSFGGSRRR